MPTQQPQPVPFPLSSFPGADSQESGGRLINCVAEPLGDADSKSAPAQVVWRRQPGLSVFGRTSQSGYRGGLIVNQNSYEVWNNHVMTLASTGAVSDLGTFPGSKFVSIARNQVGPLPDVIAVDPDIGAYQLSGGGAPAPYNGGGVLPQPTSVGFQDGYFFFTIGDGRVFATNNNSLTMNALTFATIASRADVTLLRAIPFGSLMYFFSTGHCEVWQDVANPTPAFPYQRYSVLETGLLQTGAIAGFETGFGELLFVSQDFGVYWLSGGQAKPQKVSPPDLDRLIETAARAGQLLEAGCYEYAGKKFWHLSSPSWSWEFNLGTTRWNERWSLLPSGIHGRWRASGGHFAFGKWLLGDEQTGNMLFIDPTNPTECGRPMLWRMESGPVKIFPERVRVARMDCDYVAGVGLAVGNFIMQVQGAAAGAGGMVRLTVNDTSRVRDHDMIQVTNVGGTVEANGVWPAQLVDDTHVELIGTVFANAWTSGGTAVDITSPPEAIDPKVAISWSHNGGKTFGNPLIRRLGQQGVTRRRRVGVKNLGLSGPMGTRYRLDVTDPVYTALMGATQSSDPRVVGA